MTHDILDGEEDGEACGLVKGEGKVCLISNIVSVADVQVGWSLLEKNGVSYLTTVFIFFFYVFYVRKDIDIFHKVLYGNGVSRDSTGGP